jgi:mannan endo-1,4-beta-mannosidase
VSRVIPAGPSRPRPAALPRKAIRRAAAALLAAAGLAAAGVAAPAPAHAATTFVSRSGASFDLNGQAFRFGGTNNYYLHYSSQLMVNDVFDDAQSMGLTVLRAWTSLECGGDKPNSASACGLGTAHWMQRWSNAANGGAGGVVYNDTAAGGLVQLDAMIAAASAHGIKLILPFVNNWKDFGGMDQYVTWYGLQFHDQFYTDARIKQDYKNWITKLVNRTNTITGVQYKNDPTIFAWELANEPRCINASLPTSGTCTADTLVSWAGEMSTFVKSLDSNHMVSVGDEGFHPGQAGPANSWPYNITDGVDHTRLTALPNIDFGTYHLYPQGWGQSPVDTWGTGWINDHNAVGAALGKPEILEEFGVTDQSIRDATYTQWTNAVRTGGGDGFMFWLLTGIQDDGQLYPDFDGYRVVTPSSNATVLATAAAQFGGGGPVDNTAPSAPGTPVASNITSTGVTLNWAASTDNVGVTAYTVVSVNGSTETTVASPGTNTAAVTGLTPSTVYNFAVYARDAAGNKSARSATVSVSTAAGTGAGACVVTYKNTNQWQTGFQGDVTIQNNSANPVNGWTLRWTWANGQVMTQSWNAKFSQPAGTPNVTMSNEDWTKTIGGNGGTVNFGFIANWSGSNAAPTSFTLNSTTCTIA